MGKVSQLLLARHGETVWNVEKRLQGQHDSELTEKGITQAEQLAKEVAPFNVSKIISSTLGRAQKTAKISADYLKQSYQVMHGLEERHFGLWQGKLFHSLNQHPYYQEIFHQTTTHQPPEGESAIQATCRFTATLKNIISQYPKERCLVISHGDVLRCFLSSLSNDVVGDAYNEFTNGCLIPLNYCHSSNKFTLS